MRKLVIYGAGGHARVVWDLALRCQWKVACFFEDQPETEMLSGVPVRRYQPDFYPDALLVSGIGSGEVRLRLATSVNHDFATLIHPESLVADQVRIDAGTVVLAGAIIQTGACVGKHVIVNANAIIDHDAVVEEGAHIGPGAYIGAGSVVAAGTVVNANAVLMRFSKTQPWSVVAAGSVFDKET